MNNIIIFIIGLIAIIYAAIKLSKYADLLSKKNKKMSAAFIGSFIVSAMTSLPEFFSTVSSSAIQNVDMALSNIFGSNITNLAFIGLIDLVTKQSLLKTYPIFGWDREKIINAFFIFSNTSAFILFLCLFHFLKITNPLAYCIPIILNLYFYFYAVRTTYQLSHLVQNENKKEENEEISEEVSSISMKKIIFRLIFSGIIIFITSIVLAKSGDQISQIKVSNVAIGGTFIGFLFLAFSTSLPELVSSFHAIKLGNNKMALGTIYGSNIFNLVIYSFAEISFIISQLYYKNLPLQNILSKTAPIQIILAIISIIMLSITIIASLQGKENKGKTYSFSFSSILLLGLYISSIFLIYQFRT